MRPTHHKDPTHKIVCHRPDCDWSQETYDWLAAEIVAENHRHKTDIFALHELEFQAAYAVADLEAERDARPLDENVPRFKGDPWRGACPECGRRSISSFFRKKDRRRVWRCHLRTCEAFDIDPIDVLEEGLPGRAEA